MLDLEQQPPVGFSQWDAEQQPDWDDGDSQAPPQMDEATRDRTRNAGTLLLGADGPIAKKLPGYRARASQIEMANVVGAAIVEGDISGEGYAFVEAPTGTGKSLALLAAAVSSGKRVVISTGTLALQQQLTGSDLPFLEEALGTAILWAEAKGRSNYFCERNAASAAQNELPGIGNEMPSEALKAFRGGRWDGKKSTLTLPVLDKDWPDMAADDTCEGRSCKYRHQCPLMLAKEQLENAKIIIANHTIVLLDQFVKMRSGGKGLLPAYDVWFCDEGHTVADQAQNVFGTECSQYRPLSLVKRLKKQASALNIDLDDVDTDAIERASKDFFRTFYGAQKDQQRLDEFPSPVQAIQAVEMESLIGTLKPVQVILNREQASIPMFDQERRYAVGALADSINQLISHLRDPFREKSVSDVCYVEITADRDGQKVATLHRKPAEVGGIFRNIIMPDLSCLVVCSATLAVGKSTEKRAFIPIAQELGFELDKTECLRVPSPFNYRANVVGYLSNRVPEPRDPNYHRACAREVLQILAKSNGRAFVLFTAKRDMQKVHELVMRELYQGDTDWNVMLQGDIPKDEMIRRFRTIPNSVLFGLKTYWAGVDIPGAALSCVIIVKLPFPSAEHPLVNARIDKIKERNGDWFREFFLVKCVQDTQQAFGRLIRTQSDTGMVAILDPRMTSKPYGKQIQGSLPDIEWHRVLPDLP